MISIDGKDDFLTADEYAILKQAKRTFEHEWKPRPDGGRALVFSEAYAAARFYDLICRLAEPEGYHIGATAFLRVASQANIERAVRSTVLTKLARMFHDIREAAGALTEASVAHFGRFIREIITEVPRMVLEWVEDMNTLDPERDLKPESTAVIRGVLFSPSIDQRQAVKFWALAADSPLFPLRIFRDHCDPKEGEMFSTYHTRAFGSFLTVATEPAVVRFGACILEASRSPTKFRITNVGTSDGASWQPVPVPVEPTLGRRTLLEILGHVEGIERHAFVEQLFFPQPKDELVPVDPPQDGVHAAA